MTETKGLDIEVIQADMRRADNLYLAGDVLDADGKAEEGEARRRSGLETLF